MPSLRSLAVRERNQEPAAQCRHFVLVHLLYAGAECHSQMCCALLPFCVVLPSILTLRFGEGCEEVKG